MNKQQIAVEYERAWEAYKRQRVENTPEYWRARERFERAEYTYRRAYHDQPTD